MREVNYRTYQMLKNNIVIEEIQSATLDRAIDYFLEIHPHAYSDNAYTYKYVKKVYDR